MIVREFSIQIHITNGAEAGVDLLEEDLLVMTGKEQDMRGAQTTAKTGMIMVHNHSELKTPQDEMESHQNATFANPYTTGRENAQTFMKTTKITMYLRQTK